MSHPYIIKGVPDKILVDSLVSWPKGTVGAHQEEEVIKALNTMCKEHGYGRIPQLANAIMNIWRDPAQAKKYKKENENHNKEMARLKKLIEP